MRTITTTIFAMLTTLGLQSAHAQTLYTCGDGTVRGVSTITEMISGPPVVSTFYLAGEPEQDVTLPPPQPRAAYLVTVRLLNVTYTGEAFANAPENFDPRRLDEGEKISICVNGNQMVLDRGDGTDFRATVVRRDQLRQMPAHGTR
jgi:hypothetical protein